MSLFDRWFKKTATAALQEKTSSSEMVNESTVVEPERVVPTYLPSEKDPLVAAIATGIAAGDKPSSEFRVTRMWRRNPEARRVALIATSVVASVEGQSFVVSKIVKK